MRVITCPETLKEARYNPNKDIIVFLGGGITGCRNWQQEVIKHLSSFDPGGEGILNNVIVCNPRRSSFDITDRSMSKQQIEWEAHLLNACDVFSMYFCGGESLQPTCLYELGRYAYQKRKVDHKPVVVSIEKSYKRRFDVIEQIRCMEHQIQIDSCSYVYPLTDILVVPDDAVGPKHHVIGIVNAIYQVRSKWGRIQDYGRSQIVSSWLKGD